MTTSTNHRAWLNEITTTSTLDKPEGILIYASADGDGVFVRDHVGLRYGHAQTLVEAVAAWAEEVNFICTEPEGKLGEPLLSEVRAYKSALKGVGL